jgi:nitrogen fixation/metabolism regulation signal transduction histidine kinase
VVPIFSSPFLLVYHLIKEYATLSPFPKLFNAVHRGARNAGKEKFSIEVSMKKDNSSSMAVISVCERGTGIDPSMINKLFTKFTTTSDRGTGLGLYVSKNLI